MTIMLSSINELDLMAKSDWLMKHPITLTVQTACQQEINKHVPSACSYTSIPSSHYDIIKIISHSDFLK